ncbi:MAG: prepilin-type N-terminal cleavage/methylation domain-containing protein [Verrucomicrobia bacterium]|nr:prepilin-type N-terminal cleavage/methylation domain-containing protein [Verrucomicrobiota bacterium]
MNRQSESNVRPHRRDAFTLLELMVVIGIIALLAGLIISGSGAALRKSRITRVKAERDELVAAIDSYKAKFGFYPPDNPTDAELNPLFYELMGVTASGGPGPATVFSTKSGQESITSAAATADFKRDGFANTATTPSAIDPFLKALNDKKHNLIRTPNGNNVEVLTVPVDGLLSVPAKIWRGPLGATNLWRYVSTNPTNNPKTFDLWAEIVLGGQTTVIGNWKNGQ